MQLQHLRLDCNGYMTEEDAFLPLRDLPHLSHVSVCSCE